VEFKGTLTHAHLHHGGALEAFEAVALEVSRGVSTRAVAANAVHDAALIDVCQKKNQQA
jgi:hypothetical protein